MLNFCVLFTLPFMVVLLVETGLQHSSALFIISFVDLDCSIIKFRNS